MAARKGNQNAKGNKGGGRKTAYVERDQAQKLYQAMFERVDIEAIEQRIRTNTANVWDRILLTAMEGDTRILTMLANKAFPDNLKTEHSGGIAVKWEG